MYICTSLFVFTDHLQNCIRDFRRASRVQVMPTTLDGDELRFLRGGEELDLLGGNGLTVWGIFGALCAISLVCFCF